MRIPLEDGHLPLGVIRNYAIGSHDIGGSQQIVDHLSYCSECRDAFVREMQNAMEGKTTGQAIHGESTYPLVDFIDIVGYADIQPIAKGGMATIYSAVQEGTKRKVAIKCITEDSGRVISHEQIRRALREAQVLAKLCHPNIVSVLEVLMVRQLPALVMEHVSGVPLDKWIQANGPSSIQVVKIAIQLADAVSYAHLQGVTHCDLKPQNVLIQNAVESQPLTDPFVKLVDFGLAKFHREDFTITRPGDVLGTPAYMAPEQASGGEIHSPEAVDIYGIGAVLYELLTGRPPFVAKDRNALLAQILNQTPTLPSLIDPAISKDLETICLKCLEKSPSDRYSCAAELVQDLQAVIDGGPIAATRPSVLLRWKRQGLRNPWVAVTLLSLTALGVLVACTMVYLVYQNKKLASIFLQESQNTKDARLRAEQAEDDLLEELRNSLKEMSHQVFGSPPEQNSKAQKAVLSIAQRWQVFATRLGDSPKRVTVRAEALMRLGIIDSILGDQTASTGKLQQALELLENNVDSSQYPESRFLIAEAYHHLAIVNREQENVDASIGYFRQGLSILQECIPNDQVVQWKRLEQLSRMRIDLGTLLTLSNQFEEAKDQFDQTNELLKKAQANDAREQDYQGIATQQCRSGNRLAMLYHAQGRFREAIATLDAILDTVQRIAKSDKTNSESLEAYTIHQTLLAKCYREIGDYQKAWENLDNAIQVQRKLLSMFPSIPLLNSQLGSNLNVLAFLEAQRGMMNHAVEASTESLQIHRELLEKFPNKESYRFEKASALANLVAVRTALDQFSQANELAPELIETRRALYQAHPQRADYANGLAAALNVVGALLTKSNEPEKAEQLLCEAEQLYQTLVQLLPASQAFRSGLAKAYLLRGDLAHQTGNWSLAVEMYSRAIAMFQSNIPSPNPSDQNWIRYCYRQQASAFDALGDEESKRSVLDRTDSLR